MSLENVAAGLFNFDPTRGLQAGTSMGAQMMQIALQSQQQQLDAGAKWDQAMLSADRNALARRTQMFNEMTTNLNRFDEQARQKTAEAWATGGGGGGTSGGSSSVMYPQSEASPVPAMTEPKREFSLSEGAGFNSAPATAAPIAPTNEPSITTNIKPETTPIGGGAPAQAPGGKPFRMASGQSAAPNQFVTAPDASMSGSAPMPTAQGQVAASRGESPVSFSGGPAMTPNVSIQAPAIPAVTYNEGAHRMKLDVPYDGRPANVRYNNPGAAYPRPRDNAFGLEGYGIIGGGHQIGKYPTPVHGAASNMDLFSKGYKGMTVQGAVNKWRGGNGSLNVPEGYDPGQVIDDDFVNDKGRMVDFFEKMANHESSKFSMPRDQWEQAFDMYASGGARGGDASVIQPSRRGEVAGVESGGGGMDAGLFPQSQQPQFYGPSAESQQAPDFEQFPEYRAANEARTAYQQTLSEKMQNATKMAELRTQLMQVDQEMLAKDAEASAFGLRQADPLYKVAINPLRMQRSKIENEILGIQSQNQQVLDREKILEKSAKDADAAWKIVQDRQRAFQRAAPDAAASASPDVIFDRYVDADPRTRMKMKASFVNDREMTARLNVADEFLKSEGQGTVADDRTWKIGGSDYTLSELAQFYQDPGSMENPNPVREFVGKDPKLKQEVEALTPAGSQGSSQPQPAATPGTDPVKAKIDSLF